MNNKVKVIAVLAFLILGGFGLVAFNSTSQDKGMKMGDTTAVHKQDSSSTNAEETNQISYKDFAVSPKLIRIKKGTTVTWTNQDSAKHDVTPDSESEDFKASELFAKGMKHSVTFNKVGTFKYHCSPHPYMKGTVEVVE